MIRHTTWSLNKCTLGEKNRNFGNEAGFWSVLEYFN